MKNIANVIRLFAVLFILIISASCALPGANGRTFLRLNWTTTPDYVDFPAFPSVINTSSYVEHAEGYYQGFYRIGSYAYDADYWITVEKGDPAPDFGIGDSGDWHYLTMWLFSDGPEIYTDYIESRSIESDQDQDSASEVKELENSFDIETREAIMASAQEEAIVVEKSWTDGDLTIRGRFTIYQLDDN